MSAGQGSRGPLKVIKRNNTGEPVVLSGGEIEVQSGGAINAESGSTVTIASGATLAMNGNQTTSANVGTAGTNCTAVEYGNAWQHTTVITMTAAELAPTIPADAEGAGAVIYTFPAGVYVGKSIHSDVASGVMDAATNAADFGYGSLISSGDIATLTTAAMEDWLTGQTIADVSSFVDESSAVMTAGPPLLFEAGGSHVLNVNVAATWNGTVATASVTGVVTFHWDFLGA